MHLVIDTETSGFYNSKVPLDHPAQGRIVQLAALLLDENLNEVGQFCSYIYPDTWVMSAGAQAHHGITQETCDKYGIPIKDALRVVEGFFDCCSAVVAHGMTFDKNVIQNEGLMIDSRSLICTMQESTMPCHISFKDGRAGFKKPKLEEAIEILLQEKHNKAHDALADARGCAKLYKYLVENKMLNIAA